jgi:hypothetical protein
VIADNNSCIYHLFPAAPQNSVVAASSRNFGCIRTKRGKGAAPLAKSNSEWTLKQRRRPSLSCATVKGGLKVAVKRRFDCRRAIKELGVTTQNEIVTAFDRRPFRDLRTGSGYPSA